MAKKNIEELWEQVSPEIQQFIGEKEYELWIKPVKPVELTEDGKFIIEVPNKFFYEWMTNNLQKPLESCLQKISSSQEAYTVVFKIREGGCEDDAHANVQERSLLQQENVSVKFQLISTHTFENFVVGPSNQFAHAAALAVAKEPARAFNPLFIYGGVGLGKTHLLHAIGNYIVQHHPKLKIICTTCDHFVNDFIEAIRKEEINAFREKYRNIDCLLMDDVQFFIGKPSSQEEFFYTFNTLYDTKRQIVMTSDRAPREFPEMEERLKSRFEWGVVAAIDPPDFETRVAVLRKKAEEYQKVNNVFIPDDVLLFLAEKIKFNIRSLEGALTRLMAYSLYLNQELTIDLAKTILKDTITLEESEQRISPETILQCVAEEFKVSISELKSPKRSDRILYPRQVAMYLLRTIANLSTIEIGKIFGGKDHTTVLHACNKIKSEMTSNPYIDRLINKIIQNVKMRNRGG
jgi:chromosomal replication initiator protein